MEEMTDAPSGIIWTINPQTLIHSAIRAGRHPSYSGVNVQTTLLCFLIMKKPRRLGLIYG
jgi:hypothetical protein